MKTIPTPLVMLLCLCSASALACSTATVADDQTDPGGTRAPGPDGAESEPGPAAPPLTPEPEPGESFDPDDPNHYRWTVTVGDYYTLEVLAGTAAVQFEHLAPAGGDPTEAALLASGSVELETRLIDAASWGQLTSGPLRLATYRAEDGLPMTSCVVLVNGDAAISAHNERLAAGPPSFEPPPNITNPEHHGELLAETPGVTLLVDGDCATPSVEDNPGETRSVLSWLAVAITAEPDPRIYDPAEDGDWSAGIRR